MVLLHALCTSPYFIFPINPWGTVQGRELRLTLYRHGPICIHLVRTGARFQTHKLALTTLMCCSKLFWSNCMKRRPSYGYSTTSGRGTDQCSPSMLHRYSGEWLLGLALHVLVWSSEHWHMERSDPLDFLAWPMENPLIEPPSSLMAATWMRKLRPQRMAEAINGLSSNHLWEESLHQPGMLTALTEREENSPIGSGHWQSISGFTY